ncbi:MAG: radical SAM protein, partial [Candidatus Aenigmarchaeota archaeon]|nr:radical SAM protein [Candidatus Aenigmarchaeota archaeon]
IEKKDYKFSPFKDTRAEGHSAWVNIIKGCSNFCSYCIVPYLRGSEESKPSDAVMDEISQLAARGVVEITLLGQNVNGYGKDSGDISFIELLEKINAVEKIRWIRFLT